jgi:uncharacterized Tic20 family protein
MGYPGYPPPPQPGFPANDQQGYGPRGPSDDHLWALLAYLLTFVATIIGPLIVYAVKMNESRYVRYHAAQSLNMAITAYIGGVVAVIVGLVLAVASHGLALVLIIPLFIAYLAAHLVFLILAAIAANRGEYYRVPVFIAIPMVH